MCHGSKKRKDTRNQRMYVDSSETMRVKKTWFLKSSAMVNFFWAICDWMDLTVMKTDAKTRYL